MDPEWIGEKASTLALTSKNPKKIETQVSTIILDPDAVAGLLQGVLKNALYSDVVQKKSSFLYGKLGNKIGVNNLTIYDDGTLFDGWKTSSIDHEGVPMKKKTLIKEGILEGYLYDTYNANKENTESTGNAVRSGGFGPYSDPRGREYRFPPGIGCTNLVLEEGTTNRDSLIEDVKDGFVVSFAVGGGSSSSGDFSADARNVYKIENGEIVYPVRQAMYVGNLMDMFMNLDGLGDNMRSSGGLNPGEIYSPSIKISKGLMVGDL